MRRSGPLALLGVLACVALLAWFVRELNNVRIPATAGTSAAAGWFCQDPDSLYHMRRVERLLDEGFPVAERDPLFDSPHGARIPWPPYYTVVARGLLGPFAPRDAGPRKVFLEHGMASLPTAFAALTALVVALAAARVGGARAAWIAGGTFALLRASVDYSAPGIADHHAWATSLMAAMFAAVAAALGDAHRSAARGTRWGLLAGALGGLLVGSWVGGLVHVLVVQLVLGWALVRHAREPRPGLPALGLAFHLALAAVLAPAVLASPWKEDLPWMVVNLSWFHLALPAIGAAIFVLPVCRARTPRGYPWLVAAGVAALAVVTFTTDLPFARGVREGFAWAGRGNLFMAYVTESQPLLWGRIGGPGVFTSLLGFGAWLVVPLWIRAVVRAARSGDLSTLPWLVALPPMLAQALIQRRFAEALGVPLAVICGVELALLASARGPRWSRVLQRAPAAGLAFAALAPFALDALTVRDTAQRWARGERNPGGPVVADLRSFRELYTWLGDHAPDRGERAVLASWDQGHAIEWVAGLPTVATNFGSYVGADSYLDPMRFFLSADSARAEALLVEREARFVLILGTFSKDLEVMLRLLRPGLHHEFVTVEPGVGPRPTARWYDTLGARLMLTGKIGDPARGVLGGDSLDFLRLVHVAPRPLRSPPPIPHTSGEISAGWIWERVPGARVAARGNPGERLELAFDVEYPAAGRKLHWSRGAAADAAGRATVRVPYAGDAPNGDGRVVGPVRWSMGERSGTLVVPAAAVRSGDEVEIR